MKDKILVVGGYGNVGRVICRTLAEWYPGKVVAAGRSYQKAYQFARKTDGKVVPLQLDVSDLNNITGHLRYQRLVISSVELDNNRQLAEACLSEGTHYTEVSTSYETMRRILALRESAKKSAIIPGVGLMPGLSNVLAKELANQFAAVHLIDVHLMLGLGDAHGEDAIRWILAYANRAFEVQTKDGARTVHSLSDPKKVLFPGDTKPRHTYRFDFADQHVIPETTRAEEAASRVCFDNRLITRLLALLKSLGLAPFLQLLSPRLLARLLSNTHIGSDMFALKVIVQGTKQNCPAVVSASVQGHKEGEATGLVTAFTGRMLYEGQVPNGISHLETVVASEKLFSWLQNYGLKVDLNTT